MVQASSAILILSFFICHEVVVNAVQHTPALQPPAPPGQKVIRAVPVLPALPVPVVTRLRGDSKTGSGPALGSANALMFEPRGAAAKES